MSVRTSHGPTRRFNPWWGCKRVSDGCLHCYAETFAKRVGHKVWGGESTPRRFFGDAHWAEPLKWNRNAAERGAPFLVFCASMADVFEDRSRGYREDRHDELDEHRARLFELIEATPHLIWQLLTKRPENVMRMVPRDWSGRTGTIALQGHAVTVPSAFPPNVWIGTTVEHQAAADERIPVLLDIPARVRFLSCEPLLGPVTLREEWTGGSSVVPTPEYARMRRHLAGHIYGGRYIDWAIVGGESGNGFRPMDLDDARMLVGQLDRAAIPTWFKQVGGRTPKAGGELLDGRLIHQMPPEARR